MRCAACVAWEWSAVCGWMGEWMGGWRVQGAVQGIVECGVRVAGADGGCGALGGCRCGGCESVDTWCRVWHLAWIGCDMRVHVGACVCMLVIMRARACVRACARESEERKKERKKQKKRVVQDKNKI